MSFERMVKRQRRAKYKNLRKLRKARDMASVATRNKKEIWKLSRVIQRFPADISCSTTKGLANIIYHYMPRHRNIIKPLAKRK